MKKNKTIDIVVPVYNESESILLFDKHLSTILKKIKYNSNIIYVNDGSTDDTNIILQRLESDFKISKIIIHLSRNFGHQAAITAGLDESTGCAVITMDSDLQHPPTLIPEFIKKWENGAEIVQAVRIKTLDSFFLKSLLSSLFYKVINSISQTKIESGASDFRLLSHRIVEILRTELKERDRFIRGIVSWIGFNTEKIYYSAPPRFAGSSKFSFLRMIRLARSGIVSFSRAPLRVAIWLGIIISMLSIFYGIYAIIFSFLSPETLNKGWASLIVAITFLGGCQILFFGFMCEYIAVMFEEIKGRPIYIIQKKSSIINQRRRHS